MLLFPTYLNFGFILRKVAKVSDRHGVLIFTAVCLFFSCYSLLAKSNYRRPLDSLNKKYIIRLGISTNSKVKINGKERAVLNAGDTLKIYFKTGKEKPYKVVVYDFTNNRDKLIYPAKEDGLNESCLIDINILSDELNRYMYIDSIEATSILNLENDMVLVKGGEFLIGIADTADIEGGEDERPQHKVLLNSFYISKYEVTQALWMAVMDTNPSVHHDCYLCPVDNVSWNEIQYFISKLNKMTKYHYRLPSEAEWEYAAKGGANSKGYVYSGSNDASEVGWYLSINGFNSKRVALKKPNELGLYDMSGNINEWCSDWYGGYARNDSINPQGPSQGHLRVLRGGEWASLVEGCFVTMRGGAPPWLANQFLGFRLVRDVNK